MLHDAAETLLYRLEGVRKAGKGWSARCPAHDDRSASLSIAEAPDGKVLVYCHALCAPAEVVGAVGLSLGDLFPERRDRGHLSPAERRTVDLETRVARQWGALKAALPDLAVIEVAAGHLVAVGVADVAFASRVAGAHQRIVGLREAVQRGIA